MKISNVLRKRCKLYKRPALPKWITRQILKDNDIQLLKIMGMMFHELNQAEKAVTPKQFY